ncbi:MAG: hypothetical protein ACLSB9_22040 [Hydrogeniiclostridium mannosilyticum]|nr:hypothetical protein [Clostridiaceae bacterium]
MKKFAEELRLRNIDAAVLAKLEQIAEKKGLRRNDYIKRIIENAAYSSELLLLDEKYEALVAMVLQIIETNASEISRLTSLIERMADKDG